MLKTTGCSGCSRWGEANSPSHTDAGSWPKMSMVSLFARENDDANDIWIDGIYKEIRSEDVRTLVSSDPRSGRWFTNT